MMVRAGAAALVAAALTAAAAAAQTPAAGTGPLAVLARGGTGSSIGIVASVTLDGNAIGLRDMVAVAALRQDFHATDVLLIGALLPAGRTARLGSLNRTEMVFTHRLRDGGGFAVAVGTAAAARAAVPPGATRSLRAGAATELAVDPAGASGYAAGFLTGALAARAPVLRRGSLVVSAGAELRWYRAVGGAAVRIEAPTPLSLTAEGMTGELDVTLEGPGRASGSGFGLSASVGMTTARLSAALSMQDLGSVRVRTREARAWYVEASRMPVSELLAVLDTLQATQLGSGQFTLQLPSTLSGSAAYTVTSRLQAVATVALTRDAGAIGEAGAAWWVAPWITVAAGPRIDDGGAGLWMHLTSRVAGTALSLTGSTRGIDPAAAHSARLDGSVVVHF